MPGPGAQWSVPPGNFSQASQDRDEVLTPTTIIAPGGRIIPPEGHREGIAGEFPRDGRPAGSGPGYGGPAHGAPASPGVFPPPGYGPLPGYEFGQARGDAADPRQGPGGPGPVPPAYRAPGSPMPSGPPRHGYPGGFTGPGGPAGLNPYGAADGYPGQPPGREPGPHPGPAAYPGPNDYQAPGGYGYQGPAAYDRTVNGGDYAYVIREKPKTGPPPPSDPGPWARGDEPAPPAPAAGQASPKADTRAIPAVGGDSGSAAKAASDPDLAYGPDDPAYGPPGPDWYLRTREEPEAEETATTRDPVDEPRPARSPFEPLARASSGSGLAGAVETSAEHAAYQAGSYPSPESTGSGTAGSDDSTLGQLRDLYASAERLRPEPPGTDSADRQFDALLARQRQLISEYFKESGGLDAQAPTVHEFGAREAGDDSMASYPTGPQGTW